MAESDLIGALLGAARGAGGFLGGQFHHTQLRDQARELLEEFAFSHRIPLTIGESMQLANAIADNGYFAHSVTGLTGDHEGLLATILDKSGNHRAFHLHNGDVSEENPYQGSTLAVLRQALHG